MLTSTQGTLIQAPTEALKRISRPGAIALCSLMMIMIRTTTRLTSHDGMTSVPRLLQHLRCGCMSRHVYASVHEWIHDPRLIYWHGMAREPELLRFNNWSWTMGLYLFFFGGVFGIAATVQHGKQYRLQQERKFTVDHNDFFFSTSIPRSNFGTRGLVARDY